MKPVCVHSRSCFDKVITNLLVHKNDVHTYLIHKNSNTFVRYLIEQNKKFEYIPLDLQALASSLVISILCDILLVLIPPVRMVTKSFSMYFALILYLQNRRTIISKSAAILYSREYKL